MDKTDNPTKNVLTALFNTANFSIESKRPDSEIGCQISGFSYTRIK